MSRRHSAEKREVNPDPKFGNIIITKFMNSIMYEGKKSLAEAIVYGVLDVIEGKTKSNPVGVFHPTFAKIAHFFGDQAVAEAQLRSAHLNHVSSSRPAPPPHRAAAGRD